MTEEEWKACPWGHSLIREVRSFSNARKLRLLVVACIRKLWRHLTDQRLRDAVDVAERFAEGQANEEEFVAASSKSQWAWGEIRDASETAGHGWTYWAALMVYHATPEVLQPDNRTPWTIADRILQFVAKGHVATHDPGCSTEEELRASMSLYAHLVRDIIPSPTGVLPTFPTSWLAWNGGTIPKMSQAIYDDRQLPRGTFDNGRLAVLADALEEAGCDNADVLAHLRDGGDHVRGCWVVDGLLGKSVP